MEGARFRAHIVFAVLLAFFGALGVRLFQIQVRADDELRAAALRQQSREQKVPGRRGKILSRDGEILAVSVPSRSAFLEPFRLEDPGATAEAIAEALGLSARERGSLRDRMTDPARRRFVWIRRQISDAHAQRLEEMEIRGLGFREEYRRYYPFGVVAAQILGFVGVDHEGLSGIEQVYDDVLTGQEGWRRVWRDARGRKVLPPIRGAEAPVDGWDVVLTIDTAIQCTLENVLERVWRLHEPKAAFGVVLDPVTGDVIAAGQRPTFDPNRHLLSSPDTWRLRVLTDTCEPGSTLKPLIAAACLEEGLVTLEEKIDCERGAWRVGRRTLHDFHPYSILPFSAVISKSSNIGMAKVGMRLGPEGLHRWVVRFGLTEMTGLPLGGESPGYLTSLEDWTSYSTTSVPMGHEVAVSPLGLARSYAAIANGGILPRLRIVRRIEGRDVCREFPPESGRRVISTLTARGKIGAALVSTVVQGTGKRAAIKGTSVAGKTGTAEKIGDEDAVVASFVGFAPAEDPRYVVLVMVEEPQGRRPTGGSVAAPAVRAILKEALGSRSQEGGNLDAAQRDP